MKKEKDLQNLTDFETRFKDLMQKKIIEVDDLKDFKGDDYHKVNMELTHRINNLKGEDLDKFLLQIEKITDVSVKNQIWERNHNTITFAISELMQEYGRMPTVQEIAIKSELSRQTIHKHLKEYKTDNRYLEKKQQFEFMADKVLAKVFKFAVNGDIAAAKLYFNVVGALDKNKININTQNNYIQINGMTFNDEKLKTLKPEQLKAIEDILINSNIKNEIIQDAEIVQTKENLS